jgi:hypothetical protein
MRELPMITETKADSITPSAFTDYKLFAEFMRCFGLTARDVVKTA